MYGQCLRVQNFAFLGQSAEISTLVPAKNSHLKGLHVTHPQKKWNKQHGSPSCPRCRTRTAKLGLNHRLLYPQACVQVDSA